MTIVCIVVVGTIVDETSSEEVEDDDLSHDDNVQSPVKSPAKLSQTSAR